MLTFIVLGFSQPHVGTLYASLAKHTAETTCLGYADTPSYDTQDAEEKIRGAFGAYMNEIPRYENYKDLIALHPTLAIVCADNASCAEIAIECMQAGCHVVLEKPMVGSYADAEKLMKAAEKYKRELIVNWPIAAFPSFNKAKELADSGIIGKVLRVTYRSPATWGPYSYGPGSEVHPQLEKLSRTWWYDRKRGGGAVLDYAGYGAALTTWFFGRRAKSVQAIAKNFCLPGLDVEDYSAMLIDFGVGVGLLEGSWATFNNGEIPTGPVIYGTEGTIVCDRHTSACKVYVGRVHGHVPPTAVYDCSEPIPAYSFDEDVINHLTKGAPLHPLRRPGLNLDVMYILDEGVKAAEKALNQK